MEGRVGSGNAVSSAKTVGSPIALKGITASCIWLLAAVVSTVPAATPPELINYQGVVRDASGTPLNGSYDMVFRLFDTVAAGNEILVDEHLASMGQAVDAANGLFSTPIGGGNVTDGSGPGTYAGLAEVFADHDEVWLEIQIGTEILNPRVRVLAAAYAQSAARLDGRPATDFVDTSASQQIKTGSLVVGSATPEGGLFGLEGYGLHGGGYFEDSDHSGVAFIASGNRGILASGSEMGGSFGDADDSGFAYLGRDDRGIEAYGDEFGAYFKDLNSSGYAYLGRGDFGIEAHGNGMGGYFTDLNSSAVAFVGAVDRGVQGFGNEMGGYFADSDQSGYAYIAHQNTGVIGYGNVTGGFFQDADSNGYAYLGYGNRGLAAYGYDTGGYFKDTNHTGEAYVANGDYGILAYGSSAGGYFGNTENGHYVRVADKANPQLYAIRAVGQSGGWFTSSPTGVFGVVGAGTLSTGGNGSKSFIQNHPYDKGKVIRYVSLEGDEAGTYTRGSGRLEDGLARIQLGETYQWVTNPDIGLTAHLTPRGSATLLFVESLSTTELVVRGPEGSDAAFDYLVHGLRVGFEGQSVVTEKTAEAMIPANDPDLEAYAREPELREYTAIARFDKMTAEVTGRAVVDRSRGTALEAAIGRYDPDIHGPVSDLLGFPKPLEIPTTAFRTGGNDPASADGAALNAETFVPVAAPPPVDTAVRQLPTSDTESEPTPTVPLSAPVEPGDVLVLDPESPGSFRPGSTAADPAVAGVATAGGTEEAPVAFSGLVSCKVDAGYGSIRVGDLLTVSPTPGHAMRALDVLPGTVLGKAAEPLDAGTGTIRILITHR